MKMKPARYIHASCPQAAALLADDPYAFAMMRKLLHTRCGKIVTDHRRMIVMHTEHPYPGWVWQRADASCEELAAAYMIMQTEFAQVKKFDVRQELADYILSRQPDAYVERRLCAYICPALREAARPAPGRLHLAQMEELELATAWSCAMQREVGPDVLSEEENRSAMRDMIENRRLFFMKAQEDCVAMCSVRLQDGLGYIANVYTPPQHRRKGYADAMMREATHAVLAQKHTPALYADADYAPSNACYTGLGYEPAGTIVTLVLA